MDIFDLIVIGTGPAGEKAAVKAAYFGYTVAIVEKEKMYGGAEVVTGTLPSKTLRETALFLSGKFEKGLYGVNRGLEHEASLEDFMYRKNWISQAAAAAVYENLRNHKVSIFHGTAHFIDPHTLQVGEACIQGRYILIATGSHPYRPPYVPFDGERIHDSDTILNLKRFPHSLCIVGAGVIGCEYATIFATMGTKVYLINDKDLILPFIDQEISQELIAQMQAAEITILFNQSIEHISPARTDTDPLEITLQNKEILNVDMFLFTAGRSGNTQALDCPRIGLQRDARDQLIVNSHYQTPISHIFAAGDVIGFPALASTSMDQGRVAVAHMFQTHDLQHLPSHFPYGIYTIPEISMVGITEQEALERQIHFFTGKALYKDMPRGKILGSKSGFLKLIISKENLSILGVHIVGHIASELIHYGVLLVSEKKNLYQVIGQVFNFPTLHELYKYACYDGLSVHTGRKMKP